MHRSATDLVRLHTAISPMDDLLFRRRAVYDAALELADASEHPRAVPTDILDNPIVRGHLADVIVGTIPLDRHRLRSVDSLTNRDSRFMIGADTVRVASASSSPAALSDALRCIGSHIPEGGPGLSDVLLTEQVPTHDTAVRTLAEGIRRAIAVVPELVHDLLPHVAIFAMVGRDRSGPLGSASAREYPGLIVLPGPETALEAAEATIHEGAHQKFFDLAICCSIFNPGHHRAQPFAPPWAPPNGAPWPLEQCVAALHTYVCLATFSAALPPDLVPDRYSLLPHASDRAAILAEHVIGQAEFLGYEGRKFVGGLVGMRLSTENMSRPVKGGRDNADGSAVRVAERDCGSWRLTMRWTRPADILWEPNTNR